MTSPDNTHVRGRKHGENKYKPPVLEVSEEGCEGRPRGGEEKGALRVRRKDSKELGSGVSNFKRGLGGMPLGWPRGNVH